MKSKPDVSQFNKNRVEQEKFLENVSNSLENVSLGKMPKAYILKSYRLSWDVVKALKLYVAKKSVETASRVTETEVIEDLLRNHLNINK